MNKIRRLVQIEYERYKDKGILNICLAITLLVIVIVGGHRLGETYWPENVANSILFVNVE